MVYLYKPFLEHYRTVTVLDCVYEGKRMCVNVCVQWKYRSVLSMVVFSVLPAIIREQCFRWKWTQSNNSYSRAV